MEIFVIIPAFNEEKSIGRVVAAIPDFVKQTIVVSNNSTDRTAEVAAAAGAIVLKENRQGYGSACLHGISYVNSRAAKPSVVVFIDGDYSDYPEQIPYLIEPIVLQGYDMVIGSRALGERQRGSMTIPQVFGNWLATTLLFWLYKAKFTDLGPFRAIKLKQLNALNMCDLDYGWTVEMQVKAAKQKLKCCEVPVNYRKRIGYSKVSGTVKGTIMAGYKILWTIFKYV